ncbi:NADH dehydrogenase [Campylobacter blaseri]|uniref:NADH:ubiquinone reductase (non-electrogenic) n=1 Tax=Campylobacter blaseri TaxID=2042961 RepID=A0A2P8R439_9BACT|nr:NAD(P)/FAD-dependent oxidoreductase [Campylobacter blaseri]PSM53272.1 hypothetical protein CQ405_01640 [Campylobacter blaseri]PSM54738.1 hypothetical protein CRN67_01640 [Campylobacter blaseri]QKF86780.1 NADH dehydrogenase [Campylobacter blaseri]
MKKIIVVGAGYAGLSFIKGLTENIFSKAEVTLINNNSYHYHAAQLHKIASGEADKSVIYDIEKIIDKRVKFVVDDVTKIGKDYILAKNGKYEFDYLVLSLGYEKEMFGIEGMDDAFDLGNYEKSLAIKDEIYNKINELKNSKIDELNIVVCGGGLSGVELAGSLATELKEKEGKNNFEFNRVNIIIIEALPNILPMYDKDVVQKATQILENLGVKIMTNSKIIKKDDDGIEIENFGSLKGDIVIWTAGVKGNSLIDNSCFKSYRGRVEVNEYLKPKSCIEEIFIIGDIAAFKDKKTGKFYNPTAQIACQMGTHLAKIINAELGLAKVPKFSYKNKGSVCSIGKNYAVGNIFGKNIYGKFAVIMKEIIEKKWNFALEGFKGLLRG